MRQYALHHLERFAATGTTMARVLGNRIRRWQMASDLDDDAKAQAAATARAAIPRVIAALTSAGTLNDAAFAESRTRRLSRTGASRAKIAAHLAARGVAPVGETDELAAALAFARRRRLPPFGPALSNPADRLKALGALARAGFPRAIAEAALATPLAEAEARLAALR